MRKTAILLLISALLTLECWGVSDLRLSLAQVEQRVLKHSLKIKSANEDAEAAKNRSEAQFSSFLPKLSIDGFYRYNTVVPELALPIPGAKVQKLADNPSYSIGPSISWTMWDSGATYFAWKSAAAAARSKNEETQTVQRQIILQARTAYLQLVLASEQLISVSDALKLAESQYKDIEINALAGTKSRMDMLASHQEVLSRSRQLSQARNDLSTALRDLSSITGENYIDGRCLPADSRAESSINAYISKPNLIVTLDPIDSLISSFTSYRNAALFELHPAVESLNDLADSIKYAEKTSSSNLWPKIQLSAKTSLDYPNGPKFEEFNQNSFMANLAWPIFDSGVTKNRRSESENIYRSMIDKRDQYIIDLKKDWEKAFDTLANLDEQDKINYAAVQEAEELSEIVYKAYSNGSMSYIEVQNANYRALEAKIQFARTRIKILMNLAILASLAK